MADIVQTMMQEALGDAARSTKFEAFINFSTPALGPTNTEVYMHVKTSTFPGKAHEPIDLRFKGRSIPIRGQVKYDNTWSCTFHLTEGHELKIAFEDWIESLDQTENMSPHLSSAVKAGQARGTGYASEMAIAQMDFTGESRTSIYTLYNVFPKSVSAVPVDYASTGTVLEFTVDFSYSHYTAVQVGGVKLPAKTGGGADIPGFSAISGAGSPNFVQPNFGAVGDSLQDNLIQAGTRALDDAASSILSGALSGDMSSVGGDLRNIATNFGGSARGAVIGAFDSAAGMAFGAAQGAISGALEPVNRVFDSVGGILKSGASGALNQVSSAITSFKF